MPSNGERHTKRAVRNSNTRPLPGDPRDIRRFVRKPEIRDDRRWEERDDGLYRARGFANTEYYILYGIECTATEWKRYDRKRRIETRPIKRTPKTIGRD